MSSNGRKVSGGRRQLPESSLTSPHIFPQRIHAVGPRQQSEPAAAALPEASRVGPNQQNSCRMQITPTLKSPNLQNSCRMQIGTHLEDPPWKTILVGWIDY